MKRILQITIAFLLCTGVGWGDSTTIGYHVAAGTIYNISPGVHISSVMQDEAYTAVAGDTLVELGMYGYGYCNPPDNIMFALWRVNRTSGSFPDSLVFADTLPVGASPAADRQITDIRFGLVPGVEYVVGGAGVDPCGVGVTFYYDAGDGSDTTRFGNHSALPAWTNTVTVGDRLYAIWGVVEHNAAAPAAASLPVGPVKLGAVKLAPSQ